MSESIGAFVRRTRLARDLTQQELATQAGVGLNFVYQLESGKETVQLDCVIKVLAALEHGLTTMPLRPAAATLPRGARPPVRLPWD